MNSETLQLPDHLDLTFAGPLHAQLVPMIGVPLRIDASNVQRMSGLCLQVLLAAGLAWSAAGKTLRFENPSDAFSRALTLMGIGDLNGWLEERRTV